MALLFLTGGTAVVFLRPLLYGATVADVGSYALYLAFYVVLPGCFVYQRFRTSEDDFLLALGMGWALGHALQALALLTLKLCGLQEFLRWYPLSILPFAVWAWLRPAPPSPGTSAGAPRVVHLAALLALSATAVCRTSLFQDFLWFYGFSYDLLFHIGNAAEARNNWPLFNPRIAGIPLNYHFFSYLFPAGASLTTGLSMEELMLRHCQSVAPVLLVLQVYNAGRVYARSHAAGLAAAAMLVLHVDSGGEFAQLAGLEAKTLALNSYLHLGLYASPTTCTGLYLLATLAIVLHRWLGRGPGSSAGLLVLAFFFGLEASGVKGTVMPVALAGLAGVFAWKLVFRRSLARRALVAMLVLGMASLPMTLLLVLAPDSYASSMFHVDPLHTMRDSGIYATVVERIFGGQADDAPAWVGALLAPAWFLGHLGLVGVAALGFLAEERSRLSEAQQWILMSALAGAVPALLLAAPGYSQLFFLYNSQVGLAIVAGSAVASRCRLGGWRSIRRALPIAALAIPMATGTVRDLAFQRSRDERYELTLTPVFGEYRQGLAWLREHTEPDAIVIVAHRWILVSAYGERRAFYETDLYSPARHELASSGAIPANFTEDTGLVYREHAALRERAFSDPAGVSLDDLRAFVPDLRTAFILFDNVKPAKFQGLVDWYHIRPVELGSIPAHFGSREPAFANSAMRIYALEARGP